MISKKKIAINVHNVPQNIWVSKRESLCILYFLVLQLTCKLYYFNLCHLFICEDIVSWYNGVRVKYKLQVYSMQQSRF